MKKIQFKNPDMVLVAAGIGKVTNENITKEKYDRLLQLSDKHADLFEEKEVEEVPLFIVPKKGEPLKETKPKTKPNDIQA